MDKEKLGEWLRAILKGLVSKPDEVSVAITQDEQGVLYTVKVAPGDTGKVIGKKGATAQAIRSLLRPAGFLGDIRASLVIDAPGSAYKPGRNDDEY